MERRRNDQGARALLFERLADDEPRAASELHPLRTHDPDGLRASVLRRLNLLLNTRATRPRPEGGPLTVLDYGLPDIAALYTRDPGAHAHLAREIQRTIAAFEPRLAVAEVRVALAAGNERSLRVELSGSIRTEHMTEPVSFTIPLAGEGTAEEPL